MSDKDIKAFPQLDSSCFEPLRDRGMSLRDYFAAKAMQGLLTAEIVGEYSNDHIADIAYRIADAMMEARKK